MAWESRVLSSSKTLRMYDCVEEICCAIWYARVGMSLVISSRAPFFLEKKNVAVGRFACWRSAAIVWQIVDFPVPAGPLNQQIG